MTTSTKVYLLNANYEDERQSVIPTYAETLQVSKAWDLIEEKELTVISYGYDKRGDYVVFETVEEAIEFKLTF